MTVIDLQETQLGEILVFLNGKAIKPGGDGAYPAYGSNGIIGRTDAYKYSNGIIIGRVGAYCGSLEYCDGAFWASDNTIVAQPKNTQHDVRFLYYLLGNLNLHSYAGGAAQPLLTQTVLRQIPTAVPSLSAQRKIAAILSAYDDLIEVNTRRIALLEEMARGLYREWFVRFRFPGHDGARMVESAVGLVPEGWEVVALGDIAREVRRGVQPGQIDPETPYFGLEHLPRKSIALAEWGTASQVQSTKLAFKKGEILFGKIRPYFHKVGVAPVDGVCSSDTIVIVPKAPEDFAIVLGCVSSEELVTHATTTSQGTKMPRTSWEVLVKYPIVVPPESLLRQYNELVQDIVASILNMVFRNRNLRRTRDLLLPRLVAGEVDVEEEG